jgi:hypothetical protein
VFGAGLRRIPDIGQPLSALAAIGAAVSLSGSLLAGGVAVGMLEGGSAVREQAPHTVVYLLTEIGDLAAVCGPALCVGVIAIVLAMRTRMPVWLRVVAVIGGACGILAPFYFTYFLYLLASLAMGVAFLAGRAVRERTLDRTASIV